MRRAIAIALVLAGCAPDESSPLPSDSEDGTGTSTTGDTEDQSTAVEGESSSSTGALEMCPLAGVFRECDDTGRQYCDDFEGRLLWGPCLGDVACELTDPDTCTTMCELVDGMPTIVEVADMCSTSG